MDRGNRHDGDAIAIVCHNFSDIRRRPLVIGKLDQVRLPFVVTMPQLAVGALTFGLLFLTRPAWGAVMSDRLHIVVFVVLPVVVAQQVSRTSIEGRTVSKAALGFMRLWLAPRHGELNGHRVRPGGRSPIRVEPLLARSTGPGPIGGHVPARPATTPTASRRTLARRSRLERELAGRGLEGSPA
jgi:hypothetical protein